MTLHRPCMRLLSRSLRSKPHSTRKRPSFSCPAYQTRCGIATTRAGLQSQAAEEKSPIEGQANSSSPKYTSEAYPHIQRDSRFAHLTEDHLKHFRSILDSPSAIIDNLTSSAPDDIDPHNVDWMRKYRGRAQLVLKPSCVSHISHILSYCNTHSLAIVPQGGNTGLVGGSVPIFDEIVLSLSRMNNIRSFDEVSGVLVTDAGVILEAADGYLADRGHIFPLDLGAKGSCQVGGVVATNAGGLRLLRYGSLHGNVLGIEAVLPDGTIVDDLCTLRKNNTGYDLKQLFIGGEGTLGVITGISILCPRRSTAVNVAAFGVSSFEKCQKAFVEAKHRLGEIISAFEFMDAGSLSALQKAKGQTLPLEGGEQPFYVLLETSGSNSEHDQEKLESFLEHVMSEEIVADGVLAQDATQAANLWSVREAIPEAIGHWGGVYKYDLSLPLPVLYELVESVRAHLDSLNLVGDDASGRPVVDVIGYGHLGDSNLHLNVPTRRFDKRVENALEPFVFEEVKRRNGSISAEHGLGLAKKEFIGYSRSEGMIGLMGRLKGLFDPRGIMNPYKYV